MMVTTITKSEFFALLARDRRKRKDGSYVIRVRLIGGGFEWRPVQWTR